MTLVEYIDCNVIPIYRNLDDGHGVSHVKEVYRYACAIAKRAFGDIVYSDFILYAASMLHDIGLQHGRKDHHITGADYVEYIRPELREWLTDDGIGIIKCAVLGHRSSNSSNKLCCMYSMIIADADTMDGFSNIRRLVERVIHARYAAGGKADSIIKDAYNHILNKYGTDGYAKIHLEATNELYKDEIAHTRKFADNFDLYKQFAIDEINRIRRNS